MHLSRVNVPQKFYLLHVNFGNAQYLQERSQFCWERGGGGTQSLRSHAMCPPYCNECISLLKLWLVSASRRRGILQRRRGASGGEKLCVKVPSLLSEGLTRGIQGRGAFGALSLDTGLVSPLLLPSTTPPTTSHLQNTPQSPHLICSLLSSWPEWTVLLLQHLLYIPSLCCFVLFLPF